MTRKARQELIGIGALVGGLFLGLTLLPWHITGDWGERLGRLLWHSVGAGAVLIPFLGVGWALAASILVLLGLGAPAAWWTAQYTHEQRLALLAKEQAQGQCAWGVRRVPRLSAAWQKQRISPGTTARCREWVLLPTTSAHHSAAV